MSSRRKGREIALQILYQWEWGAQEDIDEAVREYVSGLASGDVPGEGPVLEFARSRLEGVLRHREEIDRVISKKVRGWRMERMASVDRNILRLGAYELLYCPDIPARVAINEAVELAKRFGSEESRAFVNGVLDGVLKDCRNRKEC